MKDIEEFEEKYAELTSLFLDSMKDVAEELKRPYPDWTEIVKSFAFGMKMFTRADEAVIRFIADVKELMSEYIRLKLKVEQINRIKEKRGKKEEIEKDFERWYQDVLASLNGNKNTKNVVALLYRFGGVALRNHICDALKLDPRTIDSYIQELEEKGIVRSNMIPVKGKIKFTVVYFNHPKYVNKPFPEILDILNLQTSAKGNAELPQTSSARTDDIEGKEENIEEDWTEIDELTKEV
jgi:hypothetical protein